MSCDDASTQRNPISIGLALVLATAVAAGLAAPVVGLAVVDDAQTQVIQPRVFAPAEMKKVGEPGRARPSRTVSVTLSPWPRRDVR
jgi:hypothetical protein